MTKNTQDAANLAAMRGDGNPGVVIVGEDIVQDSLGASILGAGRLSNDAGEELVILSEASLNLEAWEEVLDVSLAVSAVASVGGDAFAEEFFDGGHEWVVVRKLQVREGDVGGTEATSHRRRVVRLRVRNMLRGDPLLPVGVGDLGLLDPVLCEVSVGPDCGTVAV